MALSSVTRVSDGIQKQYDFDFGYLRKSHVFVFVNNQLRSFKWLGPFQIELLNFPQPDDTVTIRRLTDRVNRITTFTDGQTILAADLNAADLQTFYIAQEMLDQIEERILAGEVSVIGSGYITAQWIQEQLEANIAGSSQFQAISDALDNEALARANALAAEALARAAEIAQEAQARAASAAAQAEALAQETVARGAAVAAEAAARADDVLALTQADLEAGQRLTVIESDLNDNALGIKAKIATLETTVVDLDNNKAEAGEVTAIQSEIDDPTTGLKARATSLESRTTAVETGKASAAELDALEAVVTNPTTGLNSKASQTDLTTLSVAVEGKAAASTVSDLAAAVNNPTTGLSSRASQTDLTDLSVEVNGKASAASVSAIQSEIDDPTTGLKARATSLESRTTAVESGKADASDLNSLEAVVTNPTTGLNSKASQTDLTSLSSAVNGKASASDLTALEVRVGNTEGDIVTVSDAVATETGVRTSQITAANSRVDGVEVSLNRIGMSSKITEVATVEGFTTLRSGDPLTVESLPTSGIASDSLLGRSYNATWTAAGNNICQKQIFPISAGRVYRVRIVYRVTVLPPDGEANLSAIVVGITGSDFSNPASFVNPNFAVNNTDVQVLEFTVSSGANTPTNTTFPPGGSTHFRVGLRQHVQETTHVRIFSMEVEDVTPEEARFVSAESNIVNLQTTTANLQTGKAEASALTALTSSVSTLSGRTVTGGNMLTNPSFSDKGYESHSNSASFNANAPVGWRGIGAGGTGTTPYAAGWQVGNSGGSFPAWFPSNVTGFWVHQQSATTTPYYELTSDLYQVQPGKRYGVSMYTGAHGCRAQLYFFFYTAEGAWAGTGEGRTGDFLNTAEQIGGNLISSFKRLQRFATVPANATQVRFAIRKEATSSGADSYLFAWGPQLMQVPADATEMPPYQDFGDIDGQARKTAVDAAAAIVTEASTRASADSANATTIEQNRASFQAQELYPNLIKDDFSAVGGSSDFWINGWDGTVPGQYNITRGFNLPGRFQPGVLNAAFTTAGIPALGAQYGFDSHVYALGGNAADSVKVSPGDRIFLSALVAGHRCAYLGLHVMFYRSNGLYLTDYQVAQSSDQNLVQGGGQGADQGRAENFVRLSQFTTVPAEAATATLFIRATTRVDQGDPYMFWAQPMICKVPSNFSGDIPWSKQSSAVTFLREALATGSTSSARLLLGVNTTTNVATIEAVAQEGSGVWNGSAITLQANLIKLLAQDIAFGSRTQFEDGRGTIYNTEAGKRLRLLGPFGASNDLVLWYGNSSTALQSETKTNGAFALATDGKVYLGATPAGALSGISLSNYYVLAFTDTFSAFSGVVTATALDGDGTYTYFWTRTNQAGAQRVTCSNINIAGPTFSVVAGGESGDAWTCTITETSTGRSYQATVKFDITRI